MKELDHITDIGLTRQRRKTRRKSTLNIKEESFLSATSSGHLCKQTFRNGDSWLHDNLTKWTLDSAGKNTRSNGVDSFMRLIYVHGGPRV